MSTAGEPFRELKDVLLRHVFCYPAMEPTDAVKLVYQSEFGGGHLIADPERARRYLQEEYRATPQSGTAALCEPIGSGAVRVHLAALDTGGLALDTLFTAFLASAAQVRGNTERFRQKLAVLSALAAEGALPFSGTALASYLASYEEAGFPPVSHSAAYRAAYHPAYRVVHASLADSPVPPVMISGAPQGEQPVFTRSSVCGVLWDTDGRLLMLSSRYGDFGFPGGGREAGESDFDTLKREFCEETGVVLHANIGRLLCQTEIYRPDRKLPNTTFHQIVRYYFCTAAGHGKRHLSPAELRDRIEPVHVDLDAAIRANEALLPQGLPWVDRELYVLRLLRQCGWKK